MIHDQLEVPEPEVPVGLALGQKSSVISIILFSGTE
jgi:hypothetical protein